MLFKAEEEDDKENKNDDEEEAEEEEEDIGDEVSPQDLGKDDAAGQAKREPTQLKQLAVRRKIHTARDSALPVVLKAESIGKLETLLALCESLCQEGELDIMVISQGVGDLTLTDLNHAEVEITMNKAPLVPVYCFGNVDVQPAAKKWLEKNRPELKKSLLIAQHKVIYDIINSIKGHLKQRSTQRVDE